jgi:hypothetical protein
LKRLSSVFGVAFLATAIGGCGGGQTPGAGGALPQDIAGRLSLTMPHYMPAAVKPDRHPSFMSPDAKKKGALLYTGDWATNDVLVYDYPSGKQVGTLTGFDAPYGMCVDATGDVYIANFYGGTAVEYAHGGTSPLKTYTQVGEPMGCSVDANGDLAVTSFNPGGVTVFAGGDPAKGTTYTGPCEFQWMMGYDRKGDLIGIGEQQTDAISACALLAGSQSITVLSGCCTGPITIDFPGGTMWDGKYIALGDQEFGGTFGTGVYQATLSGTTLTMKGSTPLEGCTGSYDDISPFILGKKNTPVNHKQAKVAVGPDGGCSSGSIGLWHYPAGGPPFKEIANPSIPYAGAVSLR